MAGFPVFRPAGSRVVFVLLLSACAEDLALGDLPIPLLEDVTARYSVSFTAPPAPAGRSGFEANVGGAACALSDLDGDGHLDLLLTAAFGGGVWARCTHHSVGSPPGTSRGRFLFVAGAAAEDGWSPFSSDCFVGAS